jgi:DNA-binding NtrC family response regulator
MMVRDYERTLIVNALTSTGGHQRRAAAALGILPTTLVEKMKRLGISGRRTRRLVGPQQPNPIAH